MTTIWWREVELPIGRIGLASTERGLAALGLPGKLEAARSRLRRRRGESVLVPDDGRLTDAARQIDDYLAGTRRDFDLPLDPGGTPFQSAVWAAVAAVPHGRTTTYGDIARVIGAPDAVRAVGAANGDNPLPLIVPCHRIVGSSGKLTGYAGGLELKQRLLALEGAVPGDDEGWERWAARHSAGRPSLLIGPRSTRIFCRPTCRYTKRLVGVPALFDSAEEALARGFRACRVCRPH